MSLLLSRSKTKSASEIKSSSQISETHPDDPPPTSPPSRGSPAYVAEELATTARHTRGVRLRTLFSLAILTVVAVGAVVAGIAADSTPFWTGASVVFYMALAALIAYAANELGVVSKTADLLRAALKGDDRVRVDDGDEDEGDGHTRDAKLAYELGQSLERDDHLTEAEYAYALAAEYADPDGDASYAVGRLLDDADGDPDGAESWYVRAAGAGHREGSRKLGVLHGRYGIGAFGESYDWRDNAVAAYVVGREKGELRRVRLVVAGVRHELSLINGYYLVGALAVGRRRGLAARIWSELDDSNGHGVELDAADALAVKRALRRRLPDADADADADDSLSRLLSAVEEFLAGREPGRDEEE